MTHNIPFCVIYYAVVLVSISLLTRSKDMMGALNLKNESRDPDHAYLRVGCYPKANI